MFDIGWSEVMVIAVVAIVVVGPKELPRMLRTFGKTMGQVRRTANDFKRQFNDALREAEREAGLEDTKKELTAISRMEPLRNAKRDFDAAMRQGTGSGTSVKPASAVATPNKPVAVPSAPPAPAAVAAADAEPVPAEPIKTGAADSEPGAAERGSDAA